MVKGNISEVRGVRIYININKTVVLQILLSIQTGFSTDMAETSLDWREYFSQLQDTTDAISFSDPGGWSVYTIRFETDDTVFSITSVVI